LVARRRLADLKLEKQRQLRISSETAECSFAPKLEAKPPEEKDVDASEVRSEVRSGATQIARQ
jgi:hypothetical protein